jgi:hypothetical protein
LRLLCVQEIFPSCYCRETFDDKSQKAMLRYEFQFVFNGAYSDFVSILSLRSSSRILMYQDQIASIRLLARLSIVPLVIIVLLITIYTLRHWQPRWARPFIKEEPLSKFEELEFKERQPSRWWPTTLAVLAVLVVSVQVFEVIKIRETRVHGIFLLISWAQAALFIAVSCPRYCPWWLLLFYFPSIALDLFMIQSYRNLQSSLVFTRYVTISAAVVCIAIVLLMPFRPISPGSGTISVAGTTPTDTERSPEDGLRLWQFLTTSWIEPVLKIGKVRQLEKEDVWKLGYAFQNGRIAAAFRQVQSSTMLRRLLKANAVDCCILIPLTLIILFCGMAHASQSSCSCTNLG